MIQLNRFPGGLARAATFSYDDGNVEKDERLIALFDKYHVKGTFHLIGGNYVNNTPAEDAAIRERYKNHEISAHTLTHGRMVNMTSVSALREVLEDRRILERIAGYPIIGMSYPNGSYSPEVCNIVRHAGMLYARTIGNGGYAIPPDFLVWHPTCHHRDAIPSAKHFLSMIDSEWCNPVFYVWGHSHELRTEEDWAQMEELLTLIANNPKIWYATNAEICRYITAARRLEIAADESMIYNPSVIPVWVEYNKTKVIKIDPGETVHI